MILNVSKIMKTPDIPMELSFDEKIDFIESRFGKIHFIDLIKFTGKIINDGKVIFLSGELSTVLELYCDRCTAPVKMPISIEIEEKFTNDNIHDEEEGIHGFNGSEIDLKPIFIEGILLNIPMKVVCNDNCKGLCSICGQNLNKEACHCKEELLDERFAILKTLFSGSK